MTVDYHDWDEIPHQDVLYFYYDAQGKPAQVNYNGSVYTYVHNLQGDIVGILDSEGALVVEYKYDAWGCPLGKSGSMANTLGKRNPFRYRGYVYDEDSYLYYLRNRYYDPEWGRFINSDSQCGRVAEHISHNLFTYCANSPVILVDFDGQVWVMGAFAPFYGYYHKKVVDWIYANNPSISKEVFVGTGRVDLYDRITHEMYEVKPDRLIAIANGLLQLERYKAGTKPAEYGFTPLILPPDGALDETFLNTTVKVTVTQIGPIIVYSLKVERKKKSDATDPATVPVLPLPAKKNKGTSSSGAPVLAGCLAVAALFLLDSGPLKDRLLR